MEKRRWYLDTEFHEDGRVVELISIGLVSEDGRSYYAVSNEWDVSYAKRNTPWLTDNVIAKLEPVNTWKSREKIAKEILNTVLCDHRDPEFWAYFADYDFVVLCQLFGSMMKMPKRFPHLCLDIKQEMIRLDIRNDHPGMPCLDEKTAHHALVDAKHDKAMHEAIMRLEAKAIESRDKQEFQTRLCKMLEQPEDS